MICILICKKHYKERGSLIVKVAYKEAVENNQQMKEKELAAIRLASVNPSVVTEALLDITFNISDWEWVQNQCLQLISNPNEDIRGLALTCLGHIARIHAVIDKPKVLPVLRQIISQDAAVAGRVEDALDDIEIFVK
jgi:hypothetical protein